MPAARHPVRDRQGPPRRGESESSRITHADPRCVDGCAVLTLTVAGFLEDADAPLRAALAFVEDAPTELTDALEPLAEGETPSTRETSGYVVHSLQTALHDALTAESAEDAIVTAVNRGGDADTIGAIAGAVAGARFGASALPERWLEAIDDRENLASLADDLLELSRRPLPGHGRSICRRPVRATTACRGAPTGRPTGRRGRGSRRTR